MHVCACVQVLTILGCKGLESGQNLANRTGRQEDRPLLPTGTGVPRAETGASCGLGLKLPSGPTTLDVRGDLGLLQQRGNKEPRAEGGGGEGQGPSRNRCARACVRACVFSAPRTAPRHSGGKPAVDLRHSNPYDRGPRGRTMAEQGPADRTSRGGGGR